MSRSSISPAARLARRLAAVKTTQGFTIIEIIIVVTVLGLIAALVTTMGVKNYKERAYYTRAYSELGNFANALQLYLVKYNEYPPDAYRNIPPGIEEFLRDAQGHADWPNAPWPGSVYDYDYWNPDWYGPNPTVQISIRYCPLFDTATCKKNFPKQPWVDHSTWDWMSSVYWCISGSCRAHRNAPLNHPGHCINCGKPI